MGFPNSPELGSILPGQGAAWDCVFEDDFTWTSISETAYDNAPGINAKWLKTSVDTNSDGADRAQVADEADTFYDTGGWLKLTKNDNAADLETLQGYGHPVSVIAGRDIYFTARFVSEDVSATPIVIGLSNTGTDKYTSMNDFIGFRMDTDANLDYVVEDDTTETTGDTGIDLADATNATQAVTVAGWLKYPVGGTKKVRLWAKGGSGSTTTWDSGWLTSNIPDDATGLTPTIEVGKGTAAVDTIYVDYFKVWQKRA